MSSSSQQERYTPGYGAAPSSDQTRRTAGREAGFLLPYLRPGMSLLDCGCGPGTITVGLAQVLAPGRVVGIDIGPGQIQRARSHAAFQNTDNVSFSVASIYQLPFPVDYFDAALVNAVFEHLRDPMPALQELRRVLKPGGFLGVRSPMRGEVIEPANPLADRTLQLLDLVREHNGGDRGIGRRLRRMLIDAGFTHVIGSATFDFFGSPEDTRFWGERVASGVTQPPISDHLMESGLTSRAELDEIAAFWRDWGERPDAFFARPWGEAIGWKE